MIDSDRRCESLIKDTLSEDLSGWLTKKSGVERTLGLYDAQGTIRFLKRLYKTGVEQAWAVEIDAYKDDESEEMNTGRLCAKLPLDDIETRKKIFLFVNKICKEQGFDPYDDEGQNYLFFMLD